MNTENSNLAGSRRDVLVAAAGVGAAALVPTGFLPVHSAAAAVDQAIRLFRINVPEEAIVDLRRRIAETRWPDKETVTDRSQGNQLGKLQEIVRYWGTDYSWRKVEARLTRCQCS